MRVELRPNSTYFERFPNQTKPDGFAIILHHSYEWPNNANFVPKGASISIVVSPTAFYTSTDVSRLDPEERQCLYSVRWIFVKNYFVYYVFTNFSSMKLIRMVPP